MKNSWNPSEPLPTYDMLVFCHLRWDFVYQRPQHLISRFSNQYKILVVEEPIGKNPDSENEPEIFEISGNLHILRPRINHLEELGEYLTKFLKSSEYAVSWFYSSAFVSVLDTINFDTVIYDCMDELTLFKGASEKLIEQEDQLLSVADIVFTGGKSLFESKSQKHHNVHCFPSSVDVDHFSNAKSDMVKKPEDLKNIIAPIVGYFGVIDERIDLDLLKETAQKMRDFAFIMIGPLCKIGEDELPREKNIHYLGMKSYEELPQYLHFFQFAMMPFALNDATQFISPTKTLEYMSAMKPIISTKIKDVVRDYSGCVNLITDSDDFCMALTEPLLDYKKQYQEILENTSWDQTAEKMNSIINKVMA